MSILRIERLCKSFGHLKVTNHVDLKIEAGERHVVIGPNGAGKTSLINQIGGQLRSDTGAIHYRERNLVGCRPDQISRLGIARTFQKNNLFAGLSVVENVRLAVQAKHGNSLDPFTRARRRRDLIGRADEALRMVHLHHRAHHIVGDLSYGEQRELEIAAALANEPEILLLDEPAAGMSAVEAQRMVEMVAAIPRTMTIIMIEHDMHVVFSLADRITVLNYGEVLVTGTPAEIAADERVRNVYLGGVI